MFKSALKKQSGFTLIELLVVILIIISLAVVVFVALNPAERLADSRDARRTADVDSILSAVHQYIIDQRGITTGLSLTSTADFQLVTAATTSCAVATGGCSVAATACVALGTVLAPYLASLPQDPSNTTPLIGTGYAVRQDANGIITVNACGS